MPLHEQAILIMNRLETNPFGKRWVESIQKHPLHVTCAHPELILSTSQYQILDFHSQGHLGPNQYPVHNTFTGSNYTLYDSNQPDFITLHFTP